MSKHTPQPPARRHDGTGKAPRPAASTPTVEDDDRMARGARAASPTSAPGRGAIPREDKEQADRVRNVFPPHFGTQTSAAENRQTNRTAGSRGIKVVAMRPGFYNNERKRVGDVFVIADESEFSDFDTDRYDEDRLASGKTVKRRIGSGWMRKVTADVPERTTGPNAAIAKEHDEILSARHGGDGRSADRSPLEDEDADKA